MPRAAQVPSASTPASQVTKPPVGGPHPPMGHFGLSCSNIRVQISCPPPEPSASGLLLSCSSHCLLISGAPSALARRQGGSLKISQADPHQMRNTGPRWCPAGARWSEGWDPPVQDPKGQTVSDCAGSELS